ncbi:glucosaminidase domain-containing protein [Caldisericum sp.]|uniref:glucosaminidase domain-containing protein n=1 Tax=Caldisericum sp. TaxID=2499687 RepID=UPI003D0A02A2
MKKTLIILVCLALFVIILTSICTCKKQQTEVPKETATQLASTITVLRPSFMSVLQIEAFLKGTGLAGYGKAFLEAEKQSGIGADYLVAIACHESGYGSNYWWKYWNNCFSWGITDSGANSEAYKIKQMTKEEAIVYIAKQIKSLYLTPGAPYYSGETLAAINKYYASDQNWASSVIAIHNSLVKNLPEEIRAKQWIVGARILTGDMPIPTYFSADYWTKPLTREELAIILYRINGR